MTGFARTNPSLALTKYWGKLDDDLNTPATPSLAVTLEGFVTETTVEPAQTDSVVLDGVEQEPGRFHSFFDNIRDSHGIEMGFACRSSNSFPTAAGLASSASGFAALAAGCLGAAGLPQESSTVSELARFGSASAARSAYGGFTLLPASGRKAVPVHPASFWQSFRVLAVVTENRKKPISSRKAMGLARTTSPFYPAWVDDAEALTQSALAALEERDLATLGEVARLSYLRMVGTMISSNPPVLYWNSRTVAVINHLEGLRGQGVAVYETMDAGPQVKCLCLEEDLDHVRSSLEENISDIRTYSLSPAHDPVFEVRSS